jgi:hypothetical protein
MANTIAYFLAAILDEQGSSFFSPTADEVEQEQEIKSLRRVTKANNERIRSTLDVGVLTVTFMYVNNTTAQLICRTGIQFLRQFDDPSLVLIPLSLVQLSLVPLSLTPERLLVFGQYARKLHQYIVVIQLLIFLLATKVLIDRGVGVIPKGMIVRWALPELVAGAVEVQRRGEVEAERKLKELEGLRYDAKGA